MRDAAKRVLDHDDILDDLLEGEDPVSTSFSDAITETTFLDPYRPDAWAPLSRLPRGGNNLFRLGPGRFEFVSQSYCLKAGTHGPSGGNGYLWAPLRGARAEVVRAILLRSADYPEIPQRTIQQILWAIVARTDFSEMPLGLQRAAAVLLSPEELLDLEGGALGLVRDEVLERAIREMPESARKVLRAEAKLRRLLTEADATYEQMEEVAVLAGAAPQEDQIRNVPAVRWSYHPDGYFVRYRPHGYPRLRIQVYAPEPFDVERDAAGRITALSNGSGERIEIAYDRSPGEVARGSGPSVHRLRSVRFHRTRVVGPEIVVDLEREWEAPGWTLVGPVDRNEPPASLIASAPAGTRERWRRARVAVTEAERLREAADGRSPVPGSREDVRDVGHLVLALRDALEDTIAEDSMWVRDHALLAHEAWAWAACRYAEGCVGEPEQRVTLRSEAEHVRRFGTSPLFSPGPTLDAPPGGPRGCAIPANTSAQRLCPSPRNGGISGGDGPGAGGGGDGPGDDGPGDDGPGDDGPGDDGPGDDGP
ncbi:MAG: hypothetical protein R3326_08715, partial [Gemmatimonadota bacterium]|nr:hypothetical protein [Gemmatimonadota bacterium]